MTGDVFAAVHRFRKGFVPTAGRVGRSPTLPMSARRRAVVGEGAKNVRRLPVDSRLVFPTRGGAAFPARASTLENLTADGR